jgi:hypothetical protein
MSSRRKGKVPTPDGFSLAGEDITTRVNRRETAEQIFCSQCRSYRLPPFETQLRFAKEALGRLWKFDVAFPEFKLAVEIEGLVVRSILVAELAGEFPIRIADRVTNVRDVNRMTVATGRHATVQGFREDAEKYNSAAELGWTVIRFLQSDVQPGHAIAKTQRVLAARGWGGPK